jgi:hypothetical protein
LRFFLFVAIQVGEDIDDESMYFRFGGADSIGFFFVEKEMELVAGPWSATTPLDAQAVRPGGSTPEILLKVSAQPEHYIAFALRQQKSIALLKRDLIALLEDMGLEHKKAASKNDLIEILVYSVFEGEDPEVVEAILAGLVAVRKSQDEETLERLEIDENLVDAIDMLATMGGESAQGFPDLSKTLKAQRNIARKRASGAKGSKADGPEPGTDGKDDDELPQPPDDEAMEDLGEQPEPEADADGGHAGAIKVYTSPDILKSLCPGANIVPGIGLFQDFRENRFNARYEESSEFLPPKYQQKTFSRSYERVRTTEEALRLCSDWLWEKHLLLKSEARPVGATIEALGAEALHDALYPEMGHIVRP